MPADVAPQSSLQGTEPSPPRPLKCTLIWIPARGRPAKSDNKRVGGLGSFSFFSLLCQTVKDMPTHTTQLRSFSHSNACILTLRGHFGRLKKQKTKQQQTRSICCFSESDAAEWNFSFLRSTATAERRHKSWFPKSNSRSTPLGQIFDDNSPFYLLCSERLNTSRCRFNWTPGEVVGIYCSFYFYLQISISQPPCSPSLSFY